MSVWSDILRAIESGMAGSPVEITPQTGAAAVEFPTATLPASAGAAAGAIPSVKPGPKLLHPAAPSPSPGQAALNQIEQGPAVQPAEAIGQTAKAIVGVGPLAGSFRTPVVWAIIIVIALIGVWGLIAPGGGVAIVQRAIGGR